MRDPAEPSTHDGQPKLTFSKATDDVLAEEEFFSRAGRICQGQAERRTDERDKLILSHIGKATCTLAEQLHSVRADNIANAATMWRQYRPQERMPGSEQLQQLTDDALPLDAFVAALQEHAHAWARMHENLRDRADKQDVIEFHDSSRELLERYRVTINSAFQRAQDV